MSSPEQRELQRLEIENSVPRGLLESYLGLKEAPEGDEDVGIV